MLASVASGPVECPTIVVEDLPRRTQRDCPGIDRFPYTRTTGNPTKIIASANGCTNLPESDL